jgi:hypothetical protein
MQLNILKGLTRADKLIDGRCVEAGMIDQQAITRTAGLREWRENLKKNNNTRVGESFDGILALSTV